MRRLSILTITIAALLLGMGAYASAQSETFLDGKVRTGDRITIGGDEVVEGDLYIFGGDVSIDGRVTGDLVVFAGQVNITGEIGGDVFAGAGIVDVDGEVGGDVRAGAGQLQIAGSVAEDVFAGVGRLDARGSIGGDLVFGAGQVVLPGDVGGDVLGSTGSYSRSGDVAGTEDVTIEETTQRDRPGPASSALRQFGSLLVLGLIVLWLGRRRLESAVAAVDESPGGVVIRGLLFLGGLVIVPLGVTVAGVLLALLFGWIGLSLLVGVSALAVVVTWVLVVAAAILIIAVFAPISAATWAAGRVLPSETPAYGLLAAGLAVLVVLLQVPFLGPLVGFAVTIIGAGAWLATVVKPRTQSTSAPSLVTEGPAV
jgi:hypothetical protein